MATVTVQQKGKFLYTVISYKDEYGKWKNKMQTTGLIANGNKKRAQKIANERLAEFKEPIPYDENNPLLTDYLKEWLKFIKYRVAPTTFDNYEATVNRILIPYFESKELHLKDFSLKDGQKFVDDMQESNRGLGGNNPRPGTIRKYHAVLHSSLEHAVKLEKIPYNPTDHVDLPPKEDKVPNTFTESELRQLNNLLEHEDIGPLIVFESVYGCRRGESCGMRWCVLDTDNNTFEINHTVSRAKGADVKYTIIKRDCPKTPKSRRTFPLTTEIRSMFQTMKADQQANRELFGNAYNEEDSDYIFVDALGNLITPDYLSEKYARLRDKYNLPHVTLHGIRHTVATLIIKHGGSMKYLQRYLGHSDFSTTANIYAHVECEEAAEQLTDIMTNILAGEKK